MNKNNLIRTFANIWPTIKKTLDAIFYFILNLIKTIAKIAASQLTGR